MYKLPAQEILSYTIMQFHENSEVNIYVSILPEKVIDNKNKLKI